MIVNTNSKNNTGKKYIPIPSSTADLKRRSGISRAPTLKPDFLSFYVSPGSLLRLKMTIVLLTIFISLTIMIIVMAEIIYD